MVITTLLKKEEVKAEAEEKVASAHDGSRLKVYVFNEGNKESPTPCKMEKTDDGWRIRDSCL